MLMNNLGYKINLIDTFNVGYNHSTNSSHFTHRSRFFRINQVKMVDLYSITHK